MSFSNSGILIVTNDNNVADDLSEHIIKLGYRVVGIAASNEEALSKAKEVNPDLILADIGVYRGKEGIETSELIQSTLNIPIIYLTGTVGQKTLQRARLSDPFGYIIKPFDEKQIYATIETALIRYSLESELRDGRRWLNAVLNGINDGVIALDHRGVIRFINPIAKELTGFNENETMGKTLYEVFTLIDVSSKLQNPDQLIFPNNAGIKSEGMLVSLSGRKTPVESEFTILRNGKGQAEGMVLVFRDITKHRENVEEINRQRQRAEVLVEAAGRLNAQLELSTVLETICVISNQALKADATFVFLQDTEQDLFHIKATYSQLASLKKYRGITFDIEGILLKSLISEKSPVTPIGDIEKFPNPPFWDLFKEQNIHTLGIAGLYRQHDLIGVLISAFIGSPIQLSDDTLELFKGLADQAAISITNASLFEQVHHGREYQKKLTTRLVEIQESERRHLARELHDQIGQVLTGLQFELEASKNSQGEELVNRMVDAQGTVSGLIEQIREMSLNLRPPMLDDIGLLPTLEWHIERYTKQTGIKIAFQHQGLNQRLAPKVETTVYRIVQEALTNVARHSRVSEATVQLNLQDDILGVEVIDHGIGFELPIDNTRSSNAGMAGMRERANMLGGYLVVRSAPNQGTKILVMLPLDRKPVERRTHARDVIAG